VKKTLVRLVIDLGDIRAADGGQVGVTMARLGELKERGWRVPDGYAITARALDNPGDPALHDAVTQAHERLRNRTGRVGHGALRVVLRPDPVSENGASDPGRGRSASQCEPYLGAVGISDVLVYVRKCRESESLSEGDGDTRFRERLHGPGGTREEWLRYGAASRAAPSRRRAADAGATDTGHGLAVGVLELVDARSAGIVTTPDLDSSDRRTLVVEANWGLGGSVVAGDVTPDRWSVDAGSGAILQQRTGAKERWAVFSSAAGKAVTQPLPPDLAARPCLTEQEVRYLCDRAKEIAADAGSPQVIEWAIVRDAPFPENVFFLGCRPAPRTGEAGS
jgi:pyruvate,water dikinase